MSKYIKNKERKQTERILEKEDVLRYKISCKYRV